MLLSGYIARDETEAADLARTRAMLATTEDPFHRSIPLHLTASALIIHPPTARVLLRWHERQQAWLQVGGHADEGEDDLLAVALREAHEETGLKDLEPWPADAPVHVVIVPVKPKGDEPAHEHADIRYVLATYTPDEIVPENEQAQLRWLTAEEAKAQTQPNVAETIRRAGL
ncbi:NUDIX hydrolase [Virgisporangium aliadipatigenens]|uniref:NUDIX hydrolase n=1 Tax=Virgisporangium aliadipatigenens TaxID=741659 RepID=A0A8J3YUL5_9ACTN|nr:NUDIX domain-containing protein [Virgisporangium aliadipatigenens]GIJ50091.1 NUDIX hydrolase [Virgisporangium aliadipatigenens]